MLRYQTIKPGDIIVSSPSMTKGLVFSKSVILVMSHDKNGSSGVIINKLLNTLDGDEILKSLQVSDSKKAIKGNLNIKNSVTLPVYFGGPVEQEKGIILHSNDYHATPSVNITPEIAISTSSQIITDIVSHNGPMHKMLILGYSSWAAGQLIAEIKRNDWLLLLDKNDDNNQPTSTFQLLFLEDNLYRWSYALKLAGVNIANYNSSTGNA